MSIVHSRAYPEIKRLQGDIITPYNIHEVGIEDESGTRTEYQYQEHRVKDNGQPLPDIEAQRAIVYAAAEADLHAHVFGRYPMASQTSVNGEAIKALKYERDDILEACESVLNWCDGCVKYFYSLIGATYTQDPLTLTWDFAANCPVPEGLPTLGAIKAMWA